jgi:hypothetical protein
MVVKTIVQILIEGLKEMMNNYNKLKSIDCEKYKNAIMFANAVSINLHLNLQQATALEKEVVSYTLSLLR